MYIENIVIGSPTVAPENLLARDQKDWEYVEKDKTLYTNERFLPKILVSLGIYPSTSEIRRNKPELVVNLSELDFIDGLRVSKKRKIWVVVGQ